MTTTTAPARDRYQDEQRRLLREAIVQPLLESLEPALDALQLIQIAARSPLSDDAFGARVREVLAELATSTQEEARP